MTAAKSTRALLIAVLLLHILPAAASPQHHPLASPPTRRYGKLLFIRATVNHAGPFWFAFDSGAYVTLIDPLIVKQAHLTLTQTKSTITGAGQGEVPVQHSVAMTVEIQNLVLPVQDPLVLDVSTADTPSWVHGIIGAALLDSYVVEMDPDQPALRVFDPSGYRPPEDASKIPFIVENHRFFLMATLEVNNDLTVEHKLRVDTGSEDSVDDDAVKNGSEVRAATLGHGFGQNYPGQSGVFKAVHLGPFLFQHVWGPAVPHPAIGMEILRRFTVTFDAQHGLLYLVPNRHLAEPVPAPGP